jgi:hypothetical protein
MDPHRTQRVEAPLIVHVSEHAGVRFLERVKGMDFDAIRSEIAAIVGPAIAVGCTRFRVGNVNYIIEGNTVVTVTRGKTGINHAQRPEGRR